VDEEVVRNVAGLVYLGKPVFSCIQLNVNLIVCVAMADTVRICKFYENNPLSHKVGSDEYSFRLILPGDGP